MKIIVGLGLINLLKFGYIEKFKTGQNYNQKRPSILFERLSRKTASFSRVCEF
jgi:hypothetical protein